MKIVVIADTHGLAQIILDNHKDLLINIDLVILLGDMYNFEIDIIVNTFKNIPIIGIHGNHDDINLFDNTNIIDIHKSKYIQNHISFCGFQGSSKYKSSQIYGYTQEESIKEIFNMPVCDILICHDGPFGYFNNTQSHCGLKGIYKYIKKYKPKTLFFGHHHKNRYFKISHTDCYNIYGLGIFNIEKGKVIDWLCYGF